MENDYCYGQYFDSIFQRSNCFSERELRQHSVSFEDNHGRFLPKDKNARILDIGSGGGHFLRFLMKKGYVNFLGIDISEQQVKFCRENVCRNAEKADAFVFLDGCDGSYDAIVANDLLEHIAKRELLVLLRLIHRALKPGGVFISKTPNLGNPFSLFLRYKDFTHETGLTEMSMYQVLWVSGFRDITIAPLAQRGLKERLISRAISFLLSKLFWHQGFVAPRILSPVLISAARR